MHISPTAALESAVERTRTLCLEGVTIEKWLTLSLIAWVASFGEGGYSAKLPDTSDLPDWLKFDSPVIWALGAIGAGVGVALIWLGSRMKLVFIDNVMRRRVLLGEPWNYYARPALFLFALRMAFFALIGASALVALFAFFGLPPWNHLVPDFSSPSAFFSRFSAVLVVAVPVVISFGLLGLFINDFVAPVIVIEQVTGSAALARAWRAVTRAGVGNLFVYFLLRIVLSMLLVSVAFVAMLMTCCLGALPFLSTVILLPAYVFLMAFSVAFLEQLCRAPNAD